MSPTDPPVTSPPPPGACTPNARSLLALTLVPGLGPVRIAQLIESLGSVEAILSATASQLAQLPGIGSKTVSSIISTRTNAIDRVDEELERIADQNAHVVAIGDPHYPPMLASIPSAPPILTVRGQIDIQHKHKYTCAIVGSRDCSMYGVEQAGRFASAMASAGLAIVSGGARGIDTAAHRGALNVGGQTLVVLGCGIAHNYPPENATLFQEVVDRGGAIISELPVGTKPDAKNFPARNRIISGLSLGVLVIEAGRKSGALITARHANEDHGREVMGVPGRVDSPSSAGTLELLRDGAQLVVEPDDVLAILREDARHLFSGTHQAKTSDPARQPPQASTPLVELDGEQKAIWDALESPATADDLADRLHIEPGAIRSQLTMLEIQGCIKRNGSTFQRAR